MDASDPNNLFNQIEYSRSFEVVPDGQYPYYKIKALDNREIPDELKGGYSRVEDALIVINSFLVRANDKEIVAAKNRKRKKNEKKRLKYEEKQKLNGSS